MYSFTHWHTFRHIHTLTMYYHIHKLFDNNFDNTGYGYFKLRIYDRIQSFGSNVNLESFLYLISFWWIYYYTHCNLLYSMGVKHLTFHQSSQLHNIVHIIVSYITKSFALEKLFQSEPIPLHTFSVQLLTSRLKLCVEPVGSDK